MGRQLTQLVRDLLGLEGLSIQPVQRDDLAGEVPFFAFEDTPGRPTAKPKPVAPAVPAPEQKPPVNLKYLKIAILVLAALLGITVLAFIPRLIRMIFGESPQ